VLDLVLVPGIGVDHVPAKHQIEEAFLSGVRGSA
jgi:hypothetical protein